MDRLDKLRSSIRQVDEKIIELVKERLAISKDIGDVKSQMNLPVKDFKVEKELVERNQSLAVKLGLWPELAEDLTKILIRHSVKLQDEHQSERARKNVDGNRRVTIVGGFGQMGQWLCEFFESFGDAVSIYDQPTRPSRQLRFHVYRTLPEVCQSSDIIVLATPIRVTRKLIREIADLGSQALIFDICSLKSPILESIDYGLNRGLKLCSVHPMFGPSAKLLSGRNIIICETSNTEACDASEAIFANTTAKVIKLPVHEHDKYMAYVLGLSHLMNLIFADVLQKSGISYDEMERVSSTTYNAMLAVAESVVNENEALYYEIQAYNDHDLLGEIAASFKHYQESIEKCDEKTFTSSMRAARSFFNHASKGS